MSVSAAHFKEVTNGYEKRSDGLWLHKGKADIGATRIIGPVAASAIGAGMELLYNPSINTGYIQVLNRDTNTAGTLSLGGAGTVTLPAGSIGTAALAPGAVSALIGSYFTSPTFSTSTTGSWIATSVTTGSIACSGALCRIECSTAIYHSAPNAGFYAGVMLDGAILWALALANQATANFSVPIAWTVYYTPTAANHTFALGIYNATSGTLTVQPASFSALYVTEQRR